MPPMVAHPPAADTLAFVDESGARGYSRKLTPARDHELGLVCALLVPAPRVEEFREAFRPGYRRFLEAMPDGAKLHITDVFASGNERWATVASSVRSQFHWLIRRLQIPLIYEARRLAVERDAHALREDLVSRAKAARRSPVRVPDRPSQSTVEDQLVLGVALKLDAFCEDFGRQGVDLLFDELDPNVAQRYVDAIDRTRNIGRSTRRVKGLESSNQVPRRRRDILPGRRPVHAAHPFSWGAARRGKAGPARTRNRHCGELALRSPRGPSCQGVSQPSAEYCRMGTRRSGLWGQGRRHRRHHVTPSGSGSRTPV